MAARVNALLLMESRGCPVSSARVAAVLNFRSPAGDWAGQVEHVLTTAVLPGQSAGLRSRREVLSVPDDGSSTAGRHDADVLVVVVTGHAAPVDARGWQVDLLIKPGHGHAGLQRVADGPQDPPGRAGPPYGLIDECCLADACRVPGPGWQCRPPGRPGGRRA